MPSCFLRRAVGAHEAEDPVGLVGVAGPDLLAVDERSGRRLSSARVCSDGEVGAGARLRVTLAPTDLAARDLRAGARASAPRCRTSAAPARASRCRSCVSGERQSMRASPAPAPWPRPPTDPPPPYSLRPGRHRPATLAPCARSHTRCASDLNFALRPPQQTSSSLRIGWRISAGQFGSSQARVSARKVSSVSVSDMAEPSDRHAAVDDDGLAGHERTGRARPGTPRRRRSRRARRCGAAAWSTCAASVPPGLPTAPARSRS